MALRNIKLLERRYQGWRCSFDERDFWQGEMARVQADARLEQPQGAVWTPREGATQPLAPQQAPQRAPLLNLGRDESHRSEQDSDMATQNRQFLYGVLLFSGMFVLHMSITLPERGTLASNDERSGSGEPERTRRRGSSD